MNFIQYFNELTDDRQACPRDDLASVIANGEVDGCPMDDNHRLWYFIIVATAGHDTTSYALSGGMEAMLRDPSQLRAIHDDPAIINNAADEIIRWTSPVRHFLRYATEDTEVGGVAFAEGERVLLSLPVGQPRRRRVRRPDDLRRPPHRRRQAAVLRPRRPLLPRLAVRPAGGADAHGQAGRRARPHRARRRRRVGPLALRLRRQAPADGVLVPLTARQARHLRSLPSSLARYIAASARRRISAGVWP